MSCAIEWKKSVVIWHMEGEITSDDVLKANTEVCAYPLIDTIKAQLIIFADNSHVAISGQTIKAIAVQDAQLAKKVPEMKVAAVAKHPGAIGISRMYELSSPSTTWESKIFSTRKEAEAWIGLPRQAFVDA